MPGPLPLFLLRSALLKMGKNSIKNSKTAKALEGAGKKVPKMGKAKALEEAEKKVPKIGKSAAQKFKDRYTN